MKRTCQHHIFCAGDYTAPFAKLCATLLLATCPTELKLEIWIHIDGVSPRQSARFREWLSAPGIEPGAQIAGHWHQIMINHIAREFASEPWLTFVDADNYLIDGGWFRVVEEIDKSGVYLISQGSRKDRWAAWNGNRYYAPSTKLICFPPALHNQVCDQRFNRDYSAIEVIRQEFPGVELEMGKKIDNMVAPCLKAQLQGYRWIDVSRLVNSSHIGGFSYIRASKLHNASRKRTSMWLQRLRLNRSVRDLFRKLEWDAYLDREYEDRLLAMEAFVEESPKLKALSGCIGLSHHEQNFERVRRYLLADGTNGVMPASLSKSPDRVAGADLTLVCPHLGDGGAQRVVSILANAWAEQGRNITIITLYRHEVLYKLDPRVRWISIPDWPGVGPFVRRFRAYGLWKSQAIALWQSWFPTIATDPPWLFRLLQTFWLRTRALKRASLRRLIGSGRLRSAWKLHLPTYTRVLGLRRAIRAAGAHNVVSFCGSANVTAVLACEGEPNHLVISERNDPSRQTLRFPFGTLRTQYYGDAQIVTANTRGALATMEGYVTPDRLAYVPNPLEPRPPYSGPSGEELCSPRLLSVGRLHPQKNQAILLEALASLPDDLRQWRLSIVGQGNIEAELFTLAERLGVADRVDWHGQVDDPYRYYDAASIFVLPSILEGSPNALIEAMSCSLASIVSDASPGPLELVTHGESGLVFPVADAKALARAIEKLARSPEDRERLGTNARLRTSQHDVASVLARWEDLLERPTQSQ